MRDICVTLITVDRTPVPNYLSDTLSNLIRAGVFESPRLHSFHLVDSGISQFSSSDVAIAVHSSVRGRTANANAAEALRVGSESGAPWVLFLEDDIDICDEFLDSVGRWLDDHEDKSVVYSFGANYPLPKGSSWPYPVSLFYGTQAFAIRVDDASSLAAYLKTNEFLLNPEGTSYDLLMHRWALMRGIKEFLASVPSFVQHIGRQSVINPRPETHTFPSWPGREWVYRSRMSSLTKEPCRNFSSHSVCATVCANCWHDYESHQKVLA